MDDSFREMMHNLRRGLSGEDERPRVTLGAMSGDTVQEYQKLVELSERLLQMQDEVDIARETLWLHIKNEFGRRHESLHINSTSMTIEASE